MNTPEKVVDTVVHGGTIVTGGEQMRADLLIHAGRIVGVGHMLDGQPIAEQIDASGKYVIPGLVDAHVHFREPGMIHKEGFESGTKAAAAGGVTTVLIMPTDDPLTVTPSQVEAKARSGEGRSYVDFAVLALLGEDTSYVDALTAMGVLSLEIFVASLPPPHCIADNQSLFEACTYAAAAGMTIGFTPGDTAIVDARCAMLRLSGKRDPCSFAQSRPPIAEALGVARACLMAEHIGASLHIRQVSSKSSVRLIRDAKRRCETLSCEVMPHNLLLSQNELERQGPYAVMSPPLRCEDDMNALWAGVLDGTIDMVATDHAPHLPQEKELGRKDVWRTPLGVPGLQTCLPVMLQQVADCRLTLSDVVRLCCEAPAKRFGLYPRKGSLLPGADADLVILDLTREFEIRNDEQYSKAYVSPFAGWKITGVPVLTMLRGQTIVCDGKIKGHPTGCSIFRTYKGDIM